MPVEEEKTEGGRRWGEGRRGRRGRGEEVGRQVPGWTHTWYSREQTAQSNSSSNTDNNTDTKPSG